MPPGSCCREGPFPYQPFPALASKVPAQQVMRKRCQHLTSDSYGSCINPNKNCSRYGKPLLLPCIWQQSDRLQPAAF